MVATEAKREKQSTIWRRKGCCAMTNGKLINKLIITRTGRGTVVAKREGRGWGLLSAAPKLSVLDLVKMFTSP